MCGTLLRPAMFQVVSVLRMGKRASVCSSANVLLSTARFCRTSSNTMQSNRLIYLMQPLCKIHDKVEDPGDKLLHSTCSNVIPHGWTGESHDRGAERVSEPESWARIVFTSTTEILP